MYMYKKLLTVILLISCFNMMPLHAQNVTTQTLLIDVRTPQEYAQEHLVGAINIEYQDIVAGVKAMAPDVQTPVALYCRSGARAATAQRALREAGYVDVNNLGGLEEIKRAGVPVE